MLWAALGIGLGPLVVIFADLSFLEKAKRDEVEMAENEEKAAQDDMVNQILYQARMWDVLRAWGATPIPAGGRVNRASGIRPLPSPLYAAAPSSPGVDGVGDPVAEDGQLDDDALPEREPEPAHHSVLDDYPELRFLSGQRLVELIRSRMPPRFRIFTIARQLIRLFRRDELLIG